ncbi:MAG: PorP/SprF family type IX secretion system membrane protein [Bacteroidia bacterium]|nr:PorP/SprF family type IX secretion system membrane protein [Bacteroidia bacterium]
MKHINTTRFKALGFGTILTLAVVSTSLTAFSQIGTFSQFDLTPSLTNPASIGMVDQTQLSIMYRQQSLGSGFGYKTGGIGYIKPMFSSIGNRQLGAWGLAVMHDRSGANDMLRSTQVMATFAYNLNMSKKSIFSFGMQGAYTFSNINLSDVTTNNQYGPLGYDPSIPIGENLGAGQANAFQVNAGFMTHFYDDAGHRVGYLGVAGSNINRPNYSFLTDSDYSMPIRYTTTAGIRVYERSNLEIIPNVRWIHEGNRDKISAGPRFQYNFLSGSAGYATESAIALSAWYCNNKTSILSLDINLPKFVLGFAYDLPLATKQSTVQITNAFEVILSLKVGPKPVATKRVASTTTPAGTPNKMETNATDDDGNPDAKDQGQVDEEPAQVTPVETHTENAAVLVVDSAAVSERADAKGPAPLTADEKNLFEQKIQFKLNSSELTENSAPFLAAMVATLKAHPEYDLRITGHTCNVGSESYNQNLSMQRALAVKQALVTRGVPSDRIFVEGRGQTSPVVSNSTEEGRRRNRRVEFKLIIH